MNTLRIHYFQHVPFEGLGYIEKWAQKHGHKLSATKFYESGIIPEVGDVDWLIVMGGPMGPYDEAEYSWLIDEKKFIKAAIDADKIVLGFCLGGQMISNVLGGQVTKNREQEIGWFPITFSEKINEIPAFGDVEKSEMNVFHWHQDTFEIPRGGALLASSVGCDNQMFAYGDRVYGFQCHLEMELSSVETMLESCLYDYNSGERFVQQPKDIIEMANFEECNRFLEHFLDNLADRFF